MLESHASIVAGALIASLQALAYFLFLRRRIVTWGATEDERRRPLPGDDLAPRISSTRAITIDAPISNVWTWVIQLGADRGGFFSYSLIEKALGYDKRGTDTVPQFHDMEVGRVIPGSIEGAKRLITYDFPVVAVDPGRSFVLKNWGTFQLEALDPGRTRLIVRTHGREPSGLMSRVAEVAGTVAHFLMERRMLMGFKARAEAGAGVRLSSIPDHLWLAGIALSGAGTALLIVLGEGLWALVSSVALGVGWLVVLLLASPRPATSLGLLVLVALALAASSI